jgi:hypothetical protein
VRDGSEATLAGQWRERFEACSREKADLAAKLQAFAHAASSSSSSSSSSSPSRHQDPSQGGAMSPTPGGGGGGGNGGDQRRFAELREEYRLYRKRAMEAIAEKVRALCHR